MGKFSDEDHDRAAHLIEALQKKALSIIHDLRHSFASLAINSGASLYDVQKLLGHASSQMTQRYAHLEDTSVRRATEQVARQIGLTGTDG